ncbi:MAG: LptE family protein [Bacteroidales bacterium]|nr:LptE family protein [Bacteroidales bacterium]
MKFKNLILIFISALLSSCGVYSFKGASISKDIKTISIQYFPNYAPLIQPTLSAAFTEALQSRFTSQSRLDIVDKNGDLNIEGSIIGYSVAPIAIQSNETAAMSRLTITVSVKFTNKKDSKQDFESTFTRYADFSSTDNLSSVEENLIKQINDLLTEDIFNKALVNW